MARIPPPMPLRASVVASDGLLSDTWRRFLADRFQELSDSPLRVGSVSLTAQAASISATDVSDGANDTGLYRVSYYARISRAATTSSSLTVTIAWTDGGVACSQSGVAMTGNTTATQQNGTLFIQADGLAAVNYSTTYASVGATSMQYGLSVTLERLKT